MITEPNPADAATAVADTPNPDAVAEAQITVLEQRVTQMATALARAEQIAEQTERDRAEAEKSHAGTVADAMIAGANKIPAKPASLSAAQAADDAADGALDVIRRRLDVQKGELHGLIVSETYRRLGVMYAADAADAGTALKEFAAAAARLFAMVGPLAAPLMDAAIRSLPLDVKKARHHRMANLRLLADKLATGFHIDGVHGDFAAAAHWPTIHDAERAGAAAKPEKDDA